MPHRDLHRASGLLPFESGQTTRLRELLLGDPLLRLIRGACAVAQAPVVDLPAEQAADGPRDVFLIGGRAFVGGPAQVRDQVHRRREGVVAALDVALGDLDPSAGGAHVGASVRVGHRSADRPSVGGEGVHADVGHNAPGITGADGEAQRLACAQHALVGLHDLRAGLGHLLLGAQDVDGARGPEFRPALIQIQRRKRASERHSADLGDALRGHDPDDGVCGVGQDLALRVAAGQASGALAALRRSMVVPGLRREHRHAQGESRVPGRGRIGDGAALEAGGAAQAEALAEQQVPRDASGARQRGQGAGQGHALLASGQVDLRPSNGELRALRTCQAHGRLPRLEHVLRSGNGREHRIVDLGQLGIEGRFGRRYRSGLCICRG